MGVTPLAEPLSPRSADLPQGWEFVPLSDAVSAQKTTVDPQKNRDELFHYYSIPAYQVGTHPFILRGGDIQSQKILVQQGIVLFGKLNPRVPKIWLVRALSPLRKIASTEFIPLRPKKGRILSDYLYYLCWSSHILPRSREMVSGSTPSRQRVDVKSFSGILVPLPPLPEQRAIASILRTVQRAKEATQKVIEATRELKKSLMKQLFTYGPVTFNERLKVRLKQTVIGAMPEHWKVSLLGQVADLVMGQSPPSRSYNTSAQGTPFLQGKAEFGQVHPTAIKYCSRPIKIGPTNSVLVSVRAPVGDVNIAQRDYCIGRGLGAICPKSLLDLWYLFLSILRFRIELELRGTGSTFKSINKRVLQEFLIPVPPLAEQQRIALMLRTVQKAEEAAEARRQALEHLFQSLLHHLMTGNIRAPGSGENQDGAG